jgi:outer membrane protein assembly factor BamB
MFYGSLGGDFRAVDRKSGKILWSRKLGSGIIGNPITWKSAASSTLVSITVSAAGLACL